MTLATGGALLCAAAFGVPAGPAAEAHGVRGEVAEAHQHGEPYRMNDEEIASRAAEMFGVDEAEVASYLGTHPRAFRETFHGSMLARTSGRSFAEVMELYAAEEDWRAVENLLGVTKEAIHATMGELMAGRIADEKTNLTKEEAQALLREGYHPRDIRSAGILGKAAGRSARDVLAMKRINNRWEDIAKEIGVEPSVLREAFHPGWMMDRPRHGGPGARPEADAPGGGA